MFDACEPIAAALDKASGMSASQYLDSLGQQRDKLTRPQLTPSAKVIAAMAMRGSFFKFTMDQAEQVKKHLTTTPIEDATDTQPFADFLEGYLALP